MLSIAATRTQCIKPKQHTTLTIDISYKIRLKNGLVPFYADPNTHSM